MSGARKRGTTRTVRNGRWVLPSLFALALAFLAVVDVARELASGRVTEVRLIDHATVTFEPRSWLIDLREPPGVAGGVTVEPIHELTAGWGEPSPDGVWSIGERPVLTLRLPAGGQRTLWLQGRPDREGGPLAMRVAVNGVDCGEHLLQPGLGRYRFELPAGLVADGGNRIELELESRERAGAPAPGRSFELRRMVLADETGAGFDRVAFRRPAHLHSDSDSVVILAAGRLVVRFDAPYMGSWLGFGYRLRKPVRDGACRVVVARWFPEIGAADIIARESLDEELAEGGRYRVPLGPHLGPSVLWIDVDRAAADAELVLSGLRLTPHRPDPSP